MSRVANIYSTIYNALDALGYPVREQGTFSEGETLPETFTTYQIIDQPNNTHYDNVSASTTTRVQISLYSRKPAIKQAADTTLKTVMLPAGFLRASGRDLPFDQKTGHYGYTSDYKYYEMEG